MSCKHGNAGYCGLCVAKKRGGGGWTMTPINFAFLHQREAILSGVTRKGDTMSYTLTIGYGHTTTANHFTDVLQEETLAWLKAREGKTVTMGCFMGDLKREVEP